MKPTRLLSIIASLVLASLVLGCTDHGTRHIIACADSLSLTRPDSAMAIMDSIGQTKDRLSHSEQMYYELIRAKVQNRAYIDFTTDSVMLLVADYYDHHGSANDRMLAHYLLGCTYRDMKEAPMSLQCYYDAVEAADTTSSDCDYRTLCNIYSQIASLFHQQCTPKYALEANRKAMKYAKLADDTIRFINAYSQCALTYDRLSMCDSAKQIRIEASKMYEIIGRIDLAARTLSPLIDEYIKERDYDEAKQLIAQYEINSGYFNDRGEIRKGKELFYYYKGNYYLGVGQKDSALFYYQKLLNNCDTGNIEAGYRGLMCLYESLDICDSVSKYAQLYAEANDAYSVKHAADEIVRMQSLYNYNFIQEKLYNTAQENANYQQAIIAIISIIIICAIIAVCFVIDRRRKVHQQLLQQNRRYSFLLLEYEKANNDLQQTQSNLEQYKKDKEQEIQQLRMSISEYNDNVSNSNSNIDRVILASDMVKQLHSYAASGQFATSFELNTIMEQTKILLPDFYAHISSQHNQLTYREMLICVLTRLNFIPSEIASLLDIRMQQVTNSRSSINKKLFHNSGTKNLDMSLKLLK